MVKVSAGIAAVSWTGLMTVVGSRRTGPLLPPTRSIAPAMNPDPFTVIVKAGLFMVGNGDTDSSMIIEDCG
jgi:hypothetical protein